MPDSLAPVRSPARFVPISAIATGAPGEPAVPVSSADPLPTVPAPFSGARAVVVDAVAEAGKAVLIDCDVAGLIDFELADGSALQLNISTGVTLLPFAVRSILSVGTNASFNAWVLD